jgi:hypothetical protein
MAYLARAIMCYLCCIANKSFHQSYVFVESALWVSLLKWWCIQDQLDQLTKTKWEKLPYVLLTCVVSNLASPGMGACDPKGCYSIASVLKVKMLAQSVNMWNWKQHIPLTLLPVYQTTRNCVWEKQSLQLVAWESHPSLALHLFFYFILFYSILFYFTLLYFYFICFLFSSYS